MEFSRRVPDHPSPPIIHRWSLGPAQGRGGKSLRQQVKEEVFMIEREVFNQKSGACTVERALGITS
ncbi:MAG: hypothetical protein LH481_04005 [Burkholderiales bacterium]|nr:hypothetical protein [Burkholderiales bacterium]